MKIKMHIFNLDYFIMKPDLSDIVVCTLILFCK